MSLLRTAVVVAALCIFLSINALASDKLIAVNASSWDAAKDAVSAIEAYGGHAKFVMLPHFIIADLPEGIETSLARASSVSHIYSSAVDPARFAALGPEARHAVVAWNNVFMGMAREAGLDEEPSPDRLPLINDAAPFDKYVLPLKPPGAKYYDVSEYMLGSVMVGVILPESDGSIDASTENWTQAQMDQVTSEVVGGLNFYFTRREFRDLSFYTVFNYQVATGYEPISRSSSEEQLWISQCLTAIGYSGYPGYAYANALRDSAGTDWATLMFIVNSYNDADGMFTDGRFGYSTLGGPKTVMTYDNDGWGIANMDAVAAHEIGHSFFALDEYFDAGHGCTETSGYLAYENQNSEYPYGAGGCAINVRYCIMRSQPLSVARICNYTKGHLGWPDADNDSIPDVLDTFPTTTLNAHSPDPDTAQTVYYTGNALVTKLDNLNPYGKGNDITLNRIAKVEWRVDSGLWADAFPTDGTWDTGNEDYNFASAPLADGLHIFEARAYHTYGNMDSTPAIDSLTINRASGVGPEAAIAAMSVDVKPNPFGSRTEIAYSVPGDKGKQVPVRIRVYDIKGRQVSRLVDEIRAAGPGRVSWDGTYSNGRLAPSGVYFIDFIVGESRVVTKLVLAR